LTFGGRGVIFSFNTLKEVDHDLSGHPGMGKAQVEILCAGPKWNPGVGRESLGGSGLGLLSGRLELFLLSSDTFGTAAVLGPEGLAVEAIREADLVTPSPEAALDLLLHPARLVATLRG